MFGININKSTFLLLSLLTPAIWSMEKKKNVEEKKEELNFITRIVDRSNNLPEAIQMIKKFSKNKTFDNIFAANFGQVIVQLAKKFRIEEFNPAIQHDWIIAAYWGHKKALKWLQKQDMNKIAIWQFLFNWETNQHTAKEYEIDILRTAIINLIDGKIFDVNDISPRSHKSILQKTLQIVDRKLIEYLVKKGATMSKDQANHVLIIALETNNISLIGPAVKYGTDTGIPIWRATAVYHDLAMVKELLAHGVDPDPRLLIPVITHADLPIARELIKSFIKRGENIAEMAPTQSYNPYSRYPEVGEFLTNWSEYEQKIKTMKKFLADHDKDNATNYLTENENDWEIILGHEEKENLKLFITSDIEKAIEILDPFLKIESDLPGKEGKKEKK